MDHVHLTQGDKQAISLYGKPVAADTAVCAPAWHRRQPWLPAAAADLLSAHARCPIACEAVHGVWARARTS
eukprot:1145040-Pelagomonas_calceolata.AAC.1